MTTPSVHGGHGSPQRYLLELGVVAGMFVLFLSLMYAGEAVDGGAGPKLFVLARMAFMVLVCTWFLRRDGMRWADVGLRRPKRLWLVPVLVVAGFGGFVALLMATGPTLSALGIAPPDGSGNAGLRGDLPEYLYWAIPVTWGSAAFGEEMLLRGFILDRIARVLGWPGRRAALLAAVVLQGVLFGALHIEQGTGAMLLTGSIGVLMGLVWLAGGRNLWACIILHGLIDTVSFWEAYTAPLPG